MAKKIKFQSPTGMHDILGDDQLYFKKIYEAVKAVADFYNFSKIDTPILEQTDLFVRGIGESTDVVEKEMYSLKTKGGDSLTLRPEGTLPIARAYLEHGMFAFSQPVKLWYFGPFFRHERPQFGRYRQFWQFGFEVLGEKSPAIDAQLIQISCSILKELNFKNIIVEINSIGDSNCRPYYKKLLSSYFRKREFSLCADCKRRLRQNVLRILDCKQINCNILKEQAPQILDYLCDECRLHLKQVLEFLDELEIQYELNPYLARGFDYYTKTIFELFYRRRDEKKEETILDKKKENKEDVFEEKGDFEKLALGGGGRYDKLINSLAKKDVPSCGFGAGVERIMNIMKEEGILKKEEKKEKIIFIAQLGTLAKSKSLKIIDDFRKTKIKVFELLGKDSLKVQLARADKVGARYSLILGQKEALEDMIIIRDMKKGDQEIVKIEKVVDKINKKFKKS